MVTQIHQPSTVTPAAHPPRPTLLADVPALSRALAAPAGAPSWREQLLTRLGPLRQGFAEHVEVTEGPAGLYAELIAHAPRLDRGVRLLTREHVGIADALAALQGAAERPGVPAEEVRLRAAYLFELLSRHRQRGADLLWQAYETDLGGET
ncbi:hypothetical protein ABGB16_15160 [Micromonospora sp. B11E3]|uniref:hypothetical protein n=1 Tax=Micromonospora sp. B11E3 TaxID=3153562 RepID=UPI00325D28EB